MIKKFKENIKFRHIMWLSIVYFASQWFLLIATGIWWDDWVYADKNWNYLYEVFMQSSLPLHAYINAGLWMLPNGFNRIITFILFYVGAIFLYEILRKIDLFSEEACFWITLLYVVMPINDSRITWICYGYSLGLFMFWLAFYLAALWKEKTGVKRIVLRILSVVFLLVSYDTESIMMLTFLILFYFYYFDLNDEWEWREVGKNIKKVLFSVVKHIDYLIAPIIWYVLDKALFPGYGIYGGHSYLPWNDLLSIILHSPLNAFFTLKGIIHTYFDLLKNSKVLVMVFIILIAYIVVLIVQNKKIKNEKTSKQDSFFMNCRMAILGAVFFFLGFFPYAVKRNSFIETTGVGGRDSMLLGIGLAILLYYGAYALLREKIGKVTIIILILLGIVHFNFMYLDWQEDYYQQLQLQQEFVSNDEVKNNDTFLVMYRGQSLVENCFYQTNGNSWAVLGDQKRFFMCGVKNMYFLVNENENTLWLLNAYMMNEYDYGDRVIDGIIFVNYSEMDFRTVLKAKWNEIFNQDNFIQWIKDIRNIKYVSITKEESDNLIQLYNNGLLYDSMIYEMYEPQQ